MNPSIGRDAPQDPRGSVRAVGLGAVQVDLARDELLAEQLGDGDEGVARGWPGTSESAAPPPPSSGGCRAAARSSRVGPAHHAAVDAVGVAVTSSPAGRRPRGSPGLSARSSAATRLLIAPSGGRTRVGRVPEDRSISCAVRFDLVLDLAVAARRVAAGATRSGYRSRARPRRSRAAGPGCRRDLAEGEPGGQRVGVGQHRSRSSVWEPGPSSKVSATHFSSRQSMSRPVGGRWPRRGSSGTKSKGLTSGASIPRIRAFSAWRRARSRALAWASDRTSESPGSRSSAAATGAAASLLAALRLLPATTATVETARTGGGRGRDDGERAPARSPFRHRSS